MMNRGAESFTDLLFRFCSQPAATEGVPDLGLLEEEEEEEEEEEVEDEEEEGEERIHPNFQNHSPSSSQDGEKSDATDSGTPEDQEAMPYFSNVPDIDDAEETQPESHPIPVPWTQRVRLGKIPDSRATLSGRKSALEKAMRNYADKKSEFVVKPEIGQEFDSLAEAYDFYNLYSWEIGFGIKYGQCRRNVEKCKTVQDIVCGCAMSYIIQPANICNCIQGNHAGKIHIQYAANVLRL
ncbi:myelin transcription factor 1-like protein [Triticum dicoccoides]|uniref:myelin transcription factor 1-like protein n=1 Tax=Triticum dicoccoides TaxID=85692 RepID=UPI001890CC9D|nr:myelin transcription factor 1-like protein [Triticum dicoccoides]